MSLQKNCPQFNYCKASLKIAENFFALIDPAPVGNLCNQSSRYKKTLKKSSIILYEEKFLCTHCPPVFTSDEKTIEKPFVQ